MFIRSLIQKIIDKFMGSGLAQDRMAAEGERGLIPGTDALCRQAAAEGCVLLKNDGVLPLGPGCRAAVFGRVQLDWFYVGYGSGGSVNAPYRISLTEGLERAGVQTDGELADIYRKWTASKKNKADNGWWGHWPFSHPEMPVDPGVVGRVSERCDTAVVVIGRAAGEDRDNRLSKGSFYLTGAEIAMLDAVTAAFSRVAVVLNTGNIIDMSWTERYGDRIGAILAVWLGGMESGNAVADVLTGRANPCGRLPDTIARSYEDYPSSRNFGGRDFTEYEEDVFVGYRHFGREGRRGGVLWPFGFGLGYSDFEISCGEAELCCGAAVDVGSSPVAVVNAGSGPVAAVNVGSSPAAVDAGSGPVAVVNAGSSPVAAVNAGSSPAAVDVGSSPVAVVNAGSSPVTAVKVRVKVKNTGKYSGKDVIQLYCSQPQGMIPKASRVLVAFAKTGELEPGGDQEIVLSADIKNLAVFDEQKLAFVLEKGEYLFTVTDGTDKNAGSTGESGGIYAGRLVFDDTVIENCHRIFGGPEHLRDRIMKNAGRTEADGKAASGRPLNGTADVRPEGASTGPEEYKFNESVAEAEGLTDAELEALTRGHGMMNSPLGIKGNAGVFGGILPSLREKGVPPVICCDGPAGLRIARYCALLPCGTALAATWNTGLVAELYALEGREMAKYGADVMLCPGMNIHRDPLCGRNFEYFSEDPLLSGRMGAAVVRGIQSAGKAACPKHFACNHQEFRRNRHDARVSQRALRELYLRNFEICVKESAPLTIMTSYNKVNSVWAHYSYDLATTVLRSEWLFDGVVMTDWWMRRARSPEFPLLRDNAYRVRAGVDVLMPGNRRHASSRYISDGTLLRSLGRPGGITREEIMRSAARVIRLARKLKGTGKS